jgi:hypothetical protein
LKLVPPLVSVLEPSIRLIISFRAFSETLLIFKPYSLAFSTRFSSMRIMTFLFISITIYFLCMHRI